MVRPAIIALLAAVSPALAACGDQRPVAARGGLVELALTDYRIVPMVVHAERRRLTFRVTNEGRVPHNLEIHGPGGRIRMRVSTLLPGETDTGTVKLPRGRWVMLCAAANHEELGQHAELVVG